MSDRTESERLLAAPGRFICPLMGYQQQRQMLGLLFRELALAARHRFPLDLVLETIAASKRIYPGGRYLFPGALVVLGAVTGGLALSGLGALAIVVAAVGGLSVAFLSVRRHDDFVRYVANRLAASLARGKMLSEAMFSMPLVFNAQERHTVAMGEQSGRLAESLETLADYNAQTGQFNRLLAAILYPITVFLLCAMVLLFVLIKIVPEYVGVFHALGADLPAFTRMMINVSAHPLVAAFFFLVLLPPFLLLILTVIVPRLIQGSVVLTGLFVLFIAILFGCALVPLAFAYVGSASSSPLVAILALTSAISGSVAAAVAVYYLFRQASSSLPYLGQRLAAAVFGSLGPFRKVHLSRFLLSLGYSLRAKIPFPDALEIAGQAAGGWLRREAIRLRAVVEQGRSFSDAIAPSRWFRGQVGAILSLSDWRGSLADDCVEIAGRLRWEAQRASERLAALIEWPSIVLVGIILGAFVISIYLPIFAVGHVLK
jgi:type II secretory pathway component PulF